MSFAIHGGKSKDAVKTRREVWGVRILIPPDGALPEKTKGRSTHVCAAALLPTVPPAFVASWRRSIRGDAQCTESITFRVCSLRLCAVPMCTMRARFL